MEHCKAKLMLGNNNFGYLAYQGRYQETIWFQRASCKRMTDNLYIPSTFRVLLSLIFVCSVHASAKPNVHFQHQYCSVCQRWQLVGGRTTWKTNSTTRTTIAESKILKTTTKENTESNAENTGKDSKISNDMGWQYLEGHVGWQTRNPKRGGWLARPIPATESLAGNISAIRDRSAVQQTSPTAQERAD